MTKTLVKICGLTRAAEVEATAAAGAAYAGFVFFPKSPRYVSIDQARALCLAAPEGLAKVSLTVDMDDAGFDQMLTSVPIDILQLHGHESPSRVAAIKSRFGLPVMKAVGIADESDLAKIDEYASVADMLLIDAKPPKQADLPGGNGLTFDWRLIAGRKWTLPWMLAGGLTAASVAEAIRLTGAVQVDVSSGVESAPGTKHTALIDAFVSAANQTGEI